MWVFAFDLLLGCVHLMCTLLFFFNLNSSSLTYSVVLASGVEPHDSSLMVDRELQSLEQESSNISGRMKKVEVREGDKKMSQGIFKI